MKLFGEFSFLKMEKGTTKETKKNYLLVSLLDEDLNPCKFFVFQDNFLYQKLDGANMTVYKKITCCLEVGYYKENWSVNLADIDLNNGSK